MNINKEIIQKETTYKASRSGGKGGQNVNKVSSKVELLFSVDDSALFTDEEKSLIKEKVKSRFNKDGFIQIICDEDRSQFINKEKALDRLIILLINALHVPKKRKPVKVSKAAKAARVANKRLNSAKKESRKTNFEE